MPTRAPGSPINGREILLAWNDAQARGASQKAHARELGLSITTYHSRLWRAQAQYSGVPESRYPKWTTPLEMAGDALILCDPHIPYHDADFINLCLDLARRWFVKQLVLAGDVVDAHAFSHWPEGAGQENKKTISENAESALLDLANSMTGADAEKLRSALVEMARDPADMTDELAEARKVIKPLVDGFENIIWFMGNHEDRVIRVLEKSLGVPDLAALFGGSNPRIKFSAYYYCTLISAGVQYRITHPKPAGKGVSKRLVPKFGQHIIMAHNHHFSIQSDASGKWLGIEPGMCADPDRMDYKRQRDDGADMNVVGAVLVKDGHPWLLNKWTDWKRLAKMA